MQAAMAARLRWLWASHGRRDTPDRRLATFSKPFSSEVTCDRSRGRRYFEAGREGGVAICRTVDAGRDVGALAPAGSLTWPPRRARSPFGDLF